MVLEIRQEFSGPRGQLDARQESYSRSSLTLPIRAPEIAKILTLPSFVAVVMWSNRLKMKMFHRAMIRKLRIRRDSLCMQPGSAYLGTLVSELREYP